MTDTKTLAFLKELAEAADEAAAAGDLSLAEKLGQNRATQYYYTNVHKLHAVSEQQYAHNYPQYMAEANRLREAYEADQAREAKINTIEAQLGELKTMVQQLIEAQTETTGKGKAKKGAAKDEATDEVDPEGETEAE